MIRTNKVPSVNVDTTLKRNLSNTKLNRVCVNKIALWYFVQIEMGFLSGQSVYYTSYLCWYAF